MSFENGPFDAPDQQRGQCPKRPKPHAKWKRCFDHPKDVVYNCLLHDAMATKSAELIDQVLGKIIDDWYQRVSGYYLTKDDQENSDLAESAIELKRFHDAKGHRIKFDKGDLDFTYGLSASWEQQTLYLEVSVNNKVENFDYGNFRELLFAHYREAGSRPVTKPADLKRPLYRQLFRLPDGLDAAFQVERRVGKADIMRLSFQIGEEYVESLDRRPGASGELIERYCVAPFRNVYALVYRSTPAS